MSSKESLKIVKPSSDEERQAAEWLRRFSEAGDRQALADFFLFYHKRIYGFCVHVLRSTTEAEDATQATFIDVMRRAGEYASIVSIRCWLFGMARKACASKFRSEQRRSRRERIVMNEREDASFSTPETKAEHSEIKEVLLKVLDHMPEQLRAVFFMRYGQEMSHREIADSLGMKETTVRSVVARGLQQLKLKLSNVGVTGMPAIVLAVRSALETETPPELVNALLQLSQSSPKSVDSTSDEMYDGEVEQASENLVGRGMARSYGILASLVCVALAGGYGLWFGRSATPTGSDDTPARVKVDDLADQYWDFNAQDLNGLKIVVGKWKFGVPRNTSKKSALQFLPSLQKHEGYVQGSPVLFTPSELKLKPPVLVEFKCGTGVQKKVARFTVFSNGAFWSDKGKLPPSIRDILDPKDLFDPNGSQRPKNERLNKIPKGGLWNHYKMYIFEQEIICIENEKSWHQYKMMRPWRDANDRLYLLWVLQRGDALMDDLHIKQLNAEDVPEDIRAACRY